MRSFGEFVDKKTRRFKKHLKLIEQMLQKNNWTVKNHLDGEDEPYLFLATPGAKSSFGGIRIYQTGESVAYRIQKEEDTHPYGKAYKLNIQEMYDDLVSEEDMTELKAAKEVIEAVIKELDGFFEKSLIAEKS
jgi:hypothetical protein